MKKQQKKIEPMITIRTGEITEFVKKCNISAVVNAASPELTGSDKPGVDRSIHEYIDQNMEDGSTFKQKIMEQLDNGRKLPEKIVRCVRGKTVVTSGYSLCDYVIHVVGPEFDGKSCGNPKGRHWKFGVSSSCIRILENCYTEIIKAVRAHPEIETVAVPVISSGNYGFPFKLAFRIAVVALGNALVEWRNEDPELFDKSLLRKIYLCIYIPDGERGRQIRTAKRILEKYRNIFKRNSRATYQNSAAAHIRFVMEIVRYDGGRGYFAIAKVFRFLLLIFRTLFLPIVLVKDIFGNDWKRRRTAVEFTVFLKFLLSFVTVLYVWQRGVRSEILAETALSGIIIYLMSDTLTYLLSLIIHADIQRPSANIIRSLVFLFVNYMEVNLDLALLTYIYAPELSGLGEAVQFGILPETVSTLQGHSVLLYLNYGTKFFFMTIAFGYFSNHLRQRKFLS